MKKRNHLGSKELILVKKTLAPGGVVQLCGGPNPVALGGNDLDRFIKALQRKEALTEPGKTIPIEDVLAEMEKDKAS